LAGIERLKEQVKTLRNEITTLASSAKEELSVAMVGQTAVVVAQITAGDIKERIDELKNSHESICVMLFQVKEDKVLLASGVKNASVSAGNWVKAIAPIVGGGGGGRPDFAQAGGKDPSKITEAQEQALVYITKELQ
jgi:alanyl-tRNA synthetase